MLPHPNRLPSKGHQPRIGIQITCSVRLDLLPPKLGVPFRPGGMLRTAMPETAIYEYRDFESWKGDVRDPAWLLHHREVYAIPCPHSVKLFSYCQLCPGSFLPNPRHATAGVRGRGLDAGHGPPTQRPMTEFRWELMLRAMARPRSTGTALPIRRPRTVKLTSPFWGMNA